MIVHLDRECWNDKGDWVTQEIEVECWMRNGVVKIGNVHVDGKLLGDEERSEFKQDDKMYREIEEKYFNWFSSCEGDL